MLCECLLYCANDLYVRKISSTWLIRKGCSVGVKKAYAPRESTSDKTERKKCNT